MDVVYVDNRRVTVTSTQYYSLGYMYLRIDTDYFWNCEVLYIMHIVDRIWICLYEWWNQFCTVQFEWMDE